MGRLAEARRRREARSALARADLPEPVRTHLSTPQPPDHLPWRQVTYTVLDLETTGLDPTSDAIVAAGGLRVIGGRAAAATAFRLLVRPDRDVPADAIRIHGLLPGELEAAPPLAEQLAALLDRTLGDVLVVHVAEVDQAFLDAAMRRNWGCPLNATVLDTARMAAALNRRLQLARPPARRPGTSLRLADLARAHGLPVHPEHDPLHDALTTAQLFLALATRLERHGRGTLGALRRVAGRTYR
jgi:DNA polymerase III subunit epsilon